MDDDPDHYRFQMFLQELQNAFNDVNDILAAEEQRAIDVIEAEFEKFRADLLAKKTELIAEIEASQLDPESIAPQEWETTIQNKCAEAFGSVVHQCDEFSSALLEDIEHRLRDPVSLLQENDNNDNNDNDIIP